MWNPLRHFPRDEQGAVAVVFSIAAVALVAVGGISVDFARGFVVNSRLQAALDGAVLAGVKAAIVPDRRLAVAQQHFESTSEGILDDADVTFRIEDEAVVGEVSGAIPATVMTILGIDEIPVTVAAKATAAVFREPMCIMAMHETRKHTLELKGGVSVIGPDCHIYGNSDHYNDVVDPHTLSNFLTGKSVAAVGGGHHYLENVTPPVEFGTEIIADPLAHIAVPASGGCVQNNYVISGVAMTLPAGKYCGGLTIKNGADVALVPGGLYFINGGTFEIQSSTLTGVGATIVLTSGSANVDWTNSTIRLKAPTSGSFKGIALFGERTSTDNTFDASVVDIHGVFYMPKGAFVWTNSGTPAITAKWTAFVVDGFSWEGNGTINMPFDLAASDVPYPDEMRVIPRPGQTRLLE